MKTTHWLTLLLLLGALAWAGCSKTPPPAKGPTINGVTVELQSLQNTLAKASVDAQNLFAQARMSLRYGENGQALACLQRLAAMPNLDAKQKQAAETVVEQLKTALAKAAPAQ